MAQADYIEASTKGRIGFILLLLIFCIGYFFIEISIAIIPLPTMQPQLVEAIEFRNLVGAAFASCFIFWLLYYIVSSALSVRRHMQYPTPSMNLPIRQRVQSITKPSTIWISTSILLASLLFQLVVMWYSWYLLHKMVSEIVSELT